MREFMERVAHVTGILSRFGLYVAGTGVVLMVIIIFAQVFTRYVLGSSIAWSERAAVMLMGWFIFLGAAVGIREGYHLSFDVVLYFLPDRFKLWLYSVSDIAVMGFGFGMSWYGMQLAERASGTTIPTVGFSGSIEFYPLVLGGALLVLFTIERLARRAAGLPTVRFGDDAEDDLPAPGDAPGSDAAIRTSHSAAADKIMEH